MLMVLGPVQFEVWPFNATDYEHGHEVRLCRKAGARHQSARSNGWAKGRRPGPSRRGSFRAASAGSRI